MSVARLESRAAIAVGGPDWRSFLQGLLTQDVETLADGEARFAALLTPQGRLLYDLFVVGRGDGALLDVAAAHRDALLQRLTMYRLRAKVELAASDVGVFALFSSPSSSMEEGRGGGVRAELGGGALKGAGALQSQSRQLSGHTTTQPSSLEEEGFADPRLPALGSRLYGDFTPDADEGSYEAHRLALGVPGPADWGSEKIYPIEANFDLLNGIDFKKGCFVGQETTSRMKRRGQVKSRMAPIVFEGPAPAPGTEILAGTLRAGEVLSGVEGRAMALLRLDRALGVELNVDGRPARAEVPAWWPAGIVENAA